jgi:2-C-methyl-D-erythritol 4-phosphate cytidylyltransferase/2-C-methyl-D-erythritol 2,4-cyclodiphosphate synthase
VHVTAIVAAGGRGERLGAAQPKQLLVIGGRSILERSVHLLVAHPAIDEVVVALPPGLAAQPPAWLTRAVKTVRVVPGGPRRQDSVANAFAAISDATDVVVIHDAARPFASASLVSRTIDAAVETGAALAALPARDTVKRATDVDGPADAGRHADSGPKGPHYVLETLPRETVHLAQTPQAFRREVLASALAFGAREAIDATDEATLAERAGHRVRLVEGETTNIKITTQEDLTMAEALARPAGQAAGRAGVGYDIHRLVEGRPLILGGVTIPFDRGLVGHSDADALCHAITEAILGAAAAGDIGRHFPDSDPPWKGASSLDLLRRAAAVVGECGLRVENVDASILAERPKLAPFVDEMRRNVAVALGVDVGRVSVKGKTNEGIGEIGRGEAIAVHATAFLHAR